MSEQRSSHYVYYLTWTLLILCSIGLFASSVYRAATFPFTHDESLSFGIFSWAPAFRESFNNHLLNTFLMQSLSSWFGNSEFSLRLPNVLAHMIYLACSLLLLKRLKHSVLLLAGFVILNLNPFILDFFFLARGYGLALAFTMLSLYLLARAYEEAGRRSLVVHLALSAFAASLAVLANYSFVNYYVSLLLASAWMLLSDGSLRRFSRSRVPQAVVLFSASGIFLALILVNAFRLLSAGKDHIGGSAGFVTDTVGSLVRSSPFFFSGSQALESAISATLVGLFIVLFLFGLYIFFVKKESPLLTVFLFVMTSTVALPVVQNYFFEALFPTERAALCYIPLAAFVFLSALDWLMQRSRGPWEKRALLVLPGVMIVLLSGSFGRTFTLQGCYNWPGERHNIDIIRMIDQDRKLNFPVRASRSASPGTLSRPNIIIASRANMIGWCRSILRRWSVPTTITITFMH